jgi:hypothetical protein
MSPGTKKKKVFIILTSGKRKRLAREWRLLSGRKADESEPRRRIMGWTRTRPGWWAWG